MLYFRHVLIERPQTLIKEAIRESKTQASQNIPCLLTHLFVPYIEKLRPLLSNSRTCQMCGS